jgi:hypothetical protein
MMPLWSVSDGDDVPLSVVSLLRPVREMCASMSEGEGQRTIDGILYIIIYVVRTALV